MAGISPFLQMLLGKKRNVAAPVTPIAEVPPSPTVPIGARAPLNQPVAPPVAPIAPPEAVPTLPIKPRSRVEDAAETVRKYDQGLHPDPKTGEWVPHKRNKGLQILEGLGNYAASGIGLNLQSILHPRGTPEQQARRALGDEANIEGIDLKRRTAESGLEKDQAYEDHLKEIERQTGIKLNKRDEFSLSPGQVRYGPDGKPIASLPDRPGKDAGGFSLNPGEARYDAKGNLITERAPKPTDEVPDRSGDIAGVEKQFRGNEAAARAAADKAEADVKKYVAEQARSVENYDPTKDPNVASMTAEAQRQRAYAEDQRKRADDLVGEKLKAGAKAKPRRATGPEVGAGASVKGGGGPAPTTHAFSIRRFLSDPKNKGKTAADAKAYAAKNHPGFEVVD